MYKKCSIPRCRAVVICNIVLSAIVFLFVSFPTNASEPPKSSEIKLHNENLLPDKGKSLDKGGYLIFWHPEILRMSPKMLKDAPFVTAKKDGQPYRGVVIAQISGENGDYKFIDGSVKTAAAAVKQSLSERYDTKVKKGFLSGLAETYLKFDKKYSFSRSTLAVYDGLGIRNLIPPKLLKKGITGIELILSAPFSEEVERVLGQCRDGSFINKILRHIPTLPGPMSVNVLALTGEMEPDWEMLFKRGFKFNDEDMMPVLTKFQRCPIFAKLDKKDIELAENIQQMPIFQSLIKGYKEDLANGLIGVGITAASLAAEIALTGGASSLVKAGLRKVVKRRLKSMVVDYLVYAGTSSIIVGVPMGIKAGLKEDGEVSVSKIVKEVGFTFISTVVFDAVFHTARAIVRYRRSGVKAPAVRTVLEEEPQILRNEANYMAEEFDHVRLKKGEMIEDAEKYHAEVESKRSSGKLKRPRLISNVKYRKIEALLQSKNVTFIFHPGRGIKSQGVFEIIDFGDLLDDKVRRVFQRLREQGVGLVIDPSLDRSLVAAYYSSNSLGSTGSKGFVAFSSKLKFSEYTLVHEMQHVKDTINKSEFFAALAEYLPDDVTEEFLREHHEAISLLIRMDKEHNAHQAVYRFLRSRGWHPKDIGPILNEMLYDSYTSWNMAKAIYAVNPNYPDIGLFVVRSVSRTALVMLILDTGMGISQKVLSGMDNLLTQIISALSDNEEEDTDSKKYVPTDKTPSKFTGFQKIEPLDIEER